MTTPRGEAPLTETGPNGRNEAEPANGGNGPAEAQSPEAQAPDAQAPDAQAADAQAAEAQAPEAQAPEAQAPEAQAPEAQAAEAQAPEAQAHRTNAPDGEAAAEKEKKPRRAAHAANGPAAEKKPRRTQQRRAQAPDGHAAEKPAKAASAAKPEQEQGRAHAASGPAAEPDENLADSAAHHAGGAEGAEAALGPGLLAGSGMGQAAEALRLLGGVARRQPGALLDAWPKLGRELLRIGLGQSEVAPQKGDKRFADPAWQGNTWFRTTMQAYLALGSELDAYVDNLGLEGVELERMRFAASLVREAVAPTNFLWTNPAAIKKFLETGGGSIRKGVRNWAEDMLNNHGMPSMVDSRPFKKGENIAATPGAVVYRTEVFELIQYAPQTETVGLRPLVVVPPQVNKYYALDMSPGRSMFEYLIQHGIQLFTISWRSPTGDERHWNYDTYTQAAIEAVDVAREVTGSPDANIAGACLGGMTAGLAQAHLAALGDDRIGSVTFLVTLLDTASEGRMFLFATPETIAIAKAVSEPRGVIEGWQLASMFSWLRPNDLVWNYWVNNYLLGQDPPAFDILAWNADTTRLSTDFHHQMLDMVAGNQLVHPGAMTALGTPIDMSRITCDSYVAAGYTDHIVPWNSAYRTTQMVGGKSEFVMCSSGHIQTVVADPRHRGLGYFTNPQSPSKAEEWLAGAQRHEGTWWGHYAAWLGERSGEQVAAPQSLGSDSHPPIEPAPGHYINL